MKMPVIRKVIDVGHSKAVTIPKSWLEYYKEKTRQEIRSVTIEVDGKLTIEPPLKYHHKLHYLHKRHWNKPILLANAWFATRLMAYPGLGTIVCSTYIKNVRKTMPVSSKK